MKMCRCDRGKAKEVEEWEIIFAFWSPYFQEKGVPKSGIVARGEQNRTEERRSREENRIEHRSADLERRTE
jgi:hypothetical protein